jgi:hypothetical protein
VKWRLLSLVVASTSPLPSKGRLALAFLTAPIAASLVFSIAEFGLDFVGDGALIVWTSFVAMLAIAQTIVVGVPAFLIAKNWLSSTLLNCSAVGAAVAAVPWALIFASMSVASSSSQVFYFDGSQCCGK